MSQKGRECGHEVVIGGAIGAAAAPAVPLDAAASPLLFVLLEISGSRSLVVPLREEHAEGAVGAPGPLHRSKKLFDVLARHPPVDESLEPFNRTLVPGFEKRRRGGTERPQQALEGRLNRSDTPEGEGGGEEGDDLAVARIRVAVREPERVGVETPAPPLGPKCLQPLEEERQVGAGSL